MTDKKNEDLFQQVFELYLNRLVLFATKYVADKEYAEDIVQEAFLVLWERINNFENNKAAKSFLYTVTKNKCLNFLKRQRNTSADILERFSTDDFFNANFIKAEYAQEINDTIELLPAKQKEVFVRSYLNEHPRQEIADDMNISINTVQTHLQRSKTFLQKHLKSKLFYLFILLDFVID